MTFGMASTAVFADEAKSDKTPVEAKPAVKKAPPTTKPDNDNPPRVVDGLLSSSEYIDYLGRLKKKALMNDKKTMACYKLTPKNVNNVYDVQHKSCRVDMLKKIPPKIHPPLEIGRVDGGYESCMLVGLLKRQKISQKEFYECTHKTD
jgi:hypothetical protein